MFQSVLQPEKKVVHLTCETHCCGKKANMVIYIWNTFSHPCSSPGRKSTPIMLSRKSDVMSPCCCSPDQAFKKGPHMEKPESGRLLRVVGEAAAVCAYEPD